MGSKMGFEPGSKLGLEPGRLENGFRARLAQNGFGAWLEIKFGARAGSKLVLEPGPKWIMEPDLIQIEF